jgi:hypothetical protein
MELFLFWGISLLEIKPALGNQLRGFCLNKIDFSFLLV